MCVSVAYFDNESEEDFIKGYNDGVKQLSSAENNQNIKEGEPIIMINTQAKKIIGVGIANNKPIKVTPIDNRSVYRKDKYNKFEVTLKSVRLFPRPFDYNTVKTYIGIDSDVKSTIDNYQHLSQGGIRKLGVWPVEKKEAIIIKLVDWIESYLL